MSNHNYTQYSNSKKNDNIEPVESVIPFDSSLMVSVEETDVPVSTLVEETVETVTLPEIVKGVVANCSKLNIRVAPNIKADVVCVLDAKAELEIDVTRSTDDWFCVCTSAGVNGYCMKQYIVAWL